MTTKYGLSGSARLVGQFRREDPEEDDDQREDGEDRPGIGDADLLGVEGEGQAGVAQKPRNSTAPGRRTRWSRTRRSGLGGGSVGAPGATMPVLAASIASPPACRVVAEGLESLAERWPEEQRAVDRKREIARCLAPALVGGEIWAALAAPTNTAARRARRALEGDHHAGLVHRRGDRGETGDDRAADDEPLTAVSVSQWSDDWADARSGQSKRTDDADLGVGAAEFALDEQQQDRQGHVEAKEVEVTPDTNATKRGVSGVGRTVGEVTKGVCG